MKALFRIPVLLIATNMMCCLVRADFDLDETIEAIRSCDKPKLSLDLSGHSFDFTEAQTVVQCLQYNKTINCLNLSNQDMDGNCASVIIDAIKDNNTITTLDLSNNFISFVSQSETLQKAEENPNRTLKKLILANNLLNPKYFGRILQIMHDFEALEVINLQGNSISEHRMKDISRAAKRIMNQVWIVKEDMLLKIKPGEASIPEIEREESEEALLPYTDEGSEEEGWSGGKKKKRGGKKALIKKQFFQSNDEEDIDEEDSEEA